MHFWASRFTREFFFIYNYALRARNIDLIREIRPLEKERKNKSLNEFPC